MEKRDVMFAVAQVLEGIGEIICIGEEIREDHDECALTDFFRDRVECWN